MECINSNEKKSILNTNSGDEFYDDIEKILNNNKDDKSIIKLCTKIDALFKSDNDANQLLVINSLPILIRFYLVNFYDEKSLTDNDCKINRIRVPNLSSPSVYHNPQASALKTELTESSLSKLETEYDILVDKFKPYMNQLNFDKRMNILIFLLKVYYSHISTYCSTKSKRDLCDLCIKLNRKNNDRIRVDLSSDIYIQLLQILFFLFNNGFEVEAFKAIEAISFKADDELMTNVMLLCNSMRSFIEQTNPIHTRQSLLKTTKVFHDKNNEDHDGLQINGSMLKSKIGEVKKKDSIRDIDESGDENPADYEDCVL